MREKLSKYHIIYGEHAALSVLKYKSRQILAIYIARNKLDMLSSNVRQGYFDQIKVVESRFLDKLARCEDKHQGIVIKAGDLIEKQNFESFLDNIAKDSKKIYGFALDRIQDPHNVGAIIRSAACFDIDFLAICAHGSPTINNTIIRASAGLSEKLPIYIFCNLMHLLKHVRRYDFWIIGLDSEVNKSQDPRIIKERYDRALFILGSEGSGIRRLIKDNCDAFMRIPMTSGVDSLNVSNAASIVAYETFMSRKST